MNRIDRLFGILTLLQSKKYVTAEAIAERFGISVRTVYRDIKALGEQGIPVSFEPHKGYFVVQGYFLPPVSFTSEEANALLLMESVVKGFSDRSIRTHYATALNKVKSVLRYQQREELEALTDNIRLRVPDCFVYDFDFLSELQKAIAHKLVIEMGYQNKAGVAGTRRVEPIGLVFYALAWHLIAWCHKRQEYRDFKVARIQHMRCTTDGFTITPHQTLNDYMLAIEQQYETAWPA